VRVAVDAAATIMGGVVYFGDMAHYGASGTAAEVKNASGIRLPADAVTTAPHLSITTTAATLGFIPLSRRPR
jgi:hypothetical protein